jgi:site-specific DNA-methyltransferase (adenine-specific)
MRSALNKTLILTKEERHIVVAKLPKASHKLVSGIYCAEIENALASLPKGYFDLVVADPPYNLGRDFGNGTDKRKHGEYIEWVYNWVKHLVRCSSPHASFYIFCDWKYSGLYQDALEKAGLHIVNRITWKREKGRGAKKNWKQNMEDIWFAVRDNKHYTFNIEAVKIKKKVIAPYRENGKPKDWYITETGDAERLTHPSNIWTDFVVPFWSMPENTEHPTQKPEALIERILLASSNKGDQVLDLFSGSGTTSVVAKRLGREFVGIEMNPDFVRLGMKRLKLLDSSIR